ncbi:HipA N-terminal domain-containing protein [Quisquiliibacterium transsilvanicum]|uniref:HipA N-terminal domain-containing protein n=1 Tax=Quisquiliibacterium transsilvanicum TaxID=1549638 RepID=UPI0016164CE0
MRAEPIDDKAARPFFAGLLPEGNMRKLVAQALQVSRQNDFALLDGIGGECAGAVMLLEPGHRPQEAPAGQAVRWLDDWDLLARLDELPIRAACSCRCARWRSRWVSLRDTGAGPDLLSPPASRHEGSRTRVASRYGIKRPPAYTRARRIPGPAFFPISPRRSATARQYLNRDTCLRKRRI